MQYTSTGTAATVATTAAAVTGSISSSTPWRLPDQLYDLRQRWWRPRLSYAVLWLSWFVHELHQRCEPHIELSRCLALCRDIPVAREPPN